MRVHSVEGRVFPETPVESRLEREGRGREDGGKEMSSLTPLEIFTFRLVLPKSKESLI